MEGIFLDIINRFQLMTFNRHLKNVYLHIFPEMGKEKLI